jgi:hypothetical protein
MRAFVPPMWPDRIYYAFVLLVFVVLAWQAFDRTSPAEVLERVVVNDEVRPGGMLEVRNKMRRMRDDAEVTLYRLMYDGFNIRFQYGTETIPAGSLPVGEQVYSTRTRIPLVAAPGPSRMEVTACWARQFNLVHQVWPVCRQLKTMHFTTIAGDGQ